MGRQNTLMFAMVCLLLTGCASLTKPNLGPDPEIAKAYDETPTLENAIKVGTSMRERYLNKVEDQIGFERGLGVGLIGGAVLATDLALRSVGKNEILGIGLAGAAGYAGTNWLFSKPQQMIYAAGASAVQCALDVVQPLQASYQKREELNSKISEMQANVDAINRLVGVGPPTRKDEVIARAMVGRANAILPMARDTLGALDNAGPVLRSSLSAIQLQVTNAYIANSPNIQGLVESLSKSLPEARTKMSGAVLPNIPQPNPTLKDTSDPELSAKVKHLDQLIADIAQIIASVNLKPSDDKLKLCYVDLKQAGLSMKVVPSNGLSVRQGSSATAIVSGGVPWYRGEWIGTRPPSDQVSMSIESGQGIFTISAKAGTPPNNYQLLILDSGQGREVINVTIENGAAAHLATQPTMTGKPARAASALQVNPKVQKVQQALLNKGIKTVKVNGKDAALIADGRFGEITMEAMRQFFRDQGASDDQIPKGEQLLSETARELGIE